MELVASLGVLGLVMAPLHVQDFLMASGTQQTHSIDYIPKPMCIDVTSEVTGAFATYS